MHSIENIKYSQFTFIFEHTITLWIYGCTSSHVCF